MDPQLGMGLLSYVGFITVLSIDAKITYSVFLFGLLFKTKTITDYFTIESSKSKRVEVGYIKLILGNQMWSYNIAIEILEVIKIE